MIIPTYQKKAREYIKGPAIQSLTQRTPYRITDFPRARLRRGSSEKIRRRRISHFQLQQAVEEHIEIPENIKVSTDLTKYAVQTRYPGEYDDITFAALQCCAFFFRAVKTP
jgi:hypothetical protein